MDGNDQPTTGVLRVRMEYTAPRAAPAAAPGGRRRPGPSPGRTWQGEGREVSGGGGGGGRCERGWKMLGGGRGTGIGKGGWRRIVGERFERREGFGEE